MKCPKCSAEMIRFTEQGFTQGFMFCKEWWTHHKCLTCGYKTRSVVGDTRQESINNERRVIEKYGKDR